MAQPGKARPFLKRKSKLFAFGFKILKKNQSLTLILGTGTNSTKKTVEKTKRAKELGADAVLVVLPYYNRPPERGLFEHFKAVAEATPLPLILYNVPSRTSSSLNIETLKKTS